MSRKEWIAVIVVIGLGVLWQIPRHDDAMPAGGDTTVTSDATIVSEVERATGFGLAVHEAGPAGR